MCVYVHQVVVLVFNGQGFEQRFMAISLGPPPTGFMEKWTELHEAHFPVHITRGQELGESEPISDGNCQYLVAIWQQL